MQWGKPCIAMVNCTDFPICAYMVTGLYRLLLNSNATLYHFVPFPNPARAYRFLLTILLMFCYIVIIFLVRLLKKCYWTRKGELCMFEGEFKSKKRNTCKSFNSNTQCFPLLLQWSVPEPTTRTACPNESRTYHLPRPLRWKGSMVAGVSLTQLGVRGGGGLGSTGIPRFTKLMCPPWRLRNLRKRICNFL